MCYAGRDSVAGDYQEVSVAIVPEYYLRKQLLVPVNAVLLFSTCAGITDHIYNHEHLHL